MTKMKDKRKENLRKTTS